MLDKETQNILNNLVENYKIADLVKELSKIAVNKAHECADNNLKIEANTYYDSYYILKDCSKDLENIK